MQYFGFVGTPNIGDMNIGNMEEMAKMGVAVGMMSNVIAPIAQGEQLGIAPPAQTGWLCSCGCSCTSGNFCTNCGTKRPSLNNSWDCSCGNTGLTSKFCTNCGKKRT